MLLSSSAGGRQRLQVELELDVEREESGAAARPGTATECAHSFGALAGLAGKRQRFKSGICHLCPGQVGSLVSEPQDRR